MPVTQGLGKPLPLGSKGTHSHRRSYIHITLKPIVCIYFRVRALCHGACAEIRGQLRRVGYLHLGSGDQTQVIKFGGRQTYPLNDLSSTLKSNDFKVVKRVITLDLIKKCSCVMFFKY